MSGWRIYMLVCVLLVSVPSDQARGELELVDAVVATVDKEVILYSEIISAIESELKNIQTTSSSQSEYDRRTDELIRDSLEEAIESKILLREARKFSIEVGDDDVEARIDSLRSKYDSDEEFMAALRDVGESLSDLRERTRKQSMALYFADSKLRSLDEEIVVSEDSILQYYQENREEFEFPVRVRVRHIFLRVPESTEEREVALARLEVLRKEIEEGADFEELAKLHSQAPGAEEGGIIGWQRRGDLEYALDEVAFILQEGETSKVIEWRFGVTLLKVDEREEAGITPFEEVRLFIEKEIRAALAEERYQIWLGDLRKRSRVRIFL